MMIITSFDNPEDSKAPAVPEKNGGGQQWNVDTLPPPPPYSAAVGQPGPSRTPQPPPLPQRPTTRSSVFRPVNPQTVNHFELFSKNDAISGTYFVDPLLPSPVLKLSKKLRRKCDPVWGKCSRSLDINASYRTRHGAINLDVAVGSSNPNAVNPYINQKIPSRIYVSSRHGRINLSMREVDPGHRLDLHVESRHGRITVLLPPTFDGPVVFNARSVGAISFLPAFAARARTIRATDRETVVLCSSPDAPARLAPAPALPTKSLGDLAGADADRCLVRTRHGRVVVGILGLDHVEEPAPSGGLMRALGKFVEMQGRAFGEYVETQARSLEKTLNG